MCVQRDLLPVSRCLRSHDLTSAPADLRSQRPSPPISSKPAWPICSCGRCPRLWAPETSFESHTGRSHPAEKAAILGSAGVWMHVRLQTTEHSAFPGWLVFKQLCMILSALKDGRRWDWDWYILSSLTFSTFKSTFPFQVLLLELRFPPQHISSCLFVFTSVADRQKWTKWIPLDAPPLENSKDGSNTILHDPH